MGRLVLHKTSIHEKKYAIWFAYYYSCPEGVLRRIPAQTFVTPQYFYVGTNLRCTLSHYRVNGGGSCKLTS